MSPLDSPLPRPSTPAGTQPASGLPRPARTGPGHGRDRTHPGLRLADRLGRAILDWVAEFAYAAGFFALVLKEIAGFFRRRQSAYRVLVMQILFTGVEALGVVSILALALGAVIIIQGFMLLPQFGQGQLMYQLLVIIITRELGPILTAFIIIARSGTAIATELGGMVVSHEIQAYIAFGINPLSFLVVPRVLGVGISVVVLTLYFSIFGLLGSWVIAALATPLSFAEYTRNLLAVLLPSDIFISLAKALVFGIIVAFVACYQGFKVMKASTEVPVAGIRAVSSSFVYCIVADAIITLLYYLAFQGGR